MDEERRWPRRGARDIDRARPALHLRDDDEAYLGGERPRTLQASTWQARDARRTRYDREAYAEDRVYASERSERSERDSFSQRSHVAPSPAQMRGVDPRLPHIAEYVAEDRGVYTLWDLTTDDETQVAKSRAASDSFPPSRSHPLPGALVLRLSGFALVATLLGGAPGIALGLLVALVALVRLAMFYRRVRAWRWRKSGADLSRRLPLSATAERLRLLTAFGQSLLAVLLGGSMVALLLLIR